jgi:hypothetical protein
MSQPTAEITGVHLVSEDQHRITVLVEVGGEWRPIIREWVADVGGAISHIAEIPNVLKEDEAP